MNQTHGTNNMDQTPGMHANPVISDDVDVVDETADAAADETMDRRDHEEPHKESRGERRRREREEAKQREAEEKEAQKERERRAKEEKERIERIANLSPEGIIIYGFTLLGTKDLLNQITPEQREKMMAELLQIHHITMAPCKSAIAAFFSYADQYRRNWLSDQRKQKTIQDESKVNPMNGDGADASLGGNHMDIEGQARETANGTEGNAVKENDGANPVDDEDTQSQVVLNRIDPQILQDIESKAYEMNRRSALAKEEPIKQLKEIIAEVQAGYDHVDLSFYNQYEQLNFFCNWDYYVPENDPVRLVELMIDCMDLSDLKRTYRDHGRAEYKADVMLKLVIFGRMKGAVSTRELETACKENRKFEYLLKGQTAPDHTTFARFITDHFEPCCKDIMAQLTKILMSIGEINDEVVFIDGTKFESVAGRYTFVWKKAVNKNKEKVGQKALDLAQRLDDRYEMDVFKERDDGQKVVNIQRLVRMRRALETKASHDKVEFVTGKGHHKPQIQKDCEELDEIIEKLIEYDKHLEICGERNSYSKTDHDATFMHLKDDHMKNGQLKPAYNIQHAVNSGYIIWITSSAHPNDQYTMKETFNEMEKYLGWLPRAGVMDAGYFSEENLFYLHEKGILSYIKPMDYEKAKTRKYQKDIGLRINMQYDAEKDEYICFNQKRLVVKGTKKTVSRSGYEREITEYECHDCQGCPYKNQCIHGHNSKKPMEERSKTISASKKGILLETPNLERINSEQGKQYRMNRSIMAEGSFAQIKWNSGFVRYRHRGSGKTLADSIINGIASNVTKLANKLQFNVEGLGLHLYDLKAA